MYHYFGIPNLAIKGSYKNNNYKELLCCYFTKRDVLIETTPALTLNLNGVRSE